MWSFRSLSIWSEPRKLKLRSFSVPRKDQMSSHKNAPLTPKGREAMVRCVETGLSNARRRAVQHHAEDGAPNGSYGRTICATFWPRLHDVHAPQLGLSRCRLQNTSTYIQ